MTEALTTPTPAVGAEIRAARAHIFIRLLRNPLGVISIVIIALVALVAVLAPLLTSSDPNISSLQDVLAPPSAAHPLGADSSGRDVWSRLVYATRFTLAGALVATLVAALIGITAGLVAGYYGRWFETAASWIVSLLMALPGIVVLLAARAVLGPSIWLAMIIFGILMAPAFFRLVYAAVTGVRNELFVDAARVSGVGDLSIIGRHILTVVRAPVIIQAATVTSVAIAIQSGLNFLGLGDSSVPTWGGMLNDAFLKMYTTPLLLVWPGLAIALVSIALTLFANALRDELELSVRPSKRRRRSSSKRTALPAADEHPSTVLHEEDPSVPVREELLKIDSLRVGYDQPDGSVVEVVHNVSLVVGKGEIHGLIGESGSGKTQTAWSVLRLLPAGGRILSGSISFDGKDLAAASLSDITQLRGRRIAYIPQEPMSNLDPSFTIGSQLTEPMRVKLGLSKADAKKKAIALLTRVGIPNPERTYAAYPHEISGGMAQRVLIAGAVSCDPELIIADEPTTALDVTVQAEILDLLRELQRELGVGVLIVTHNFGVVADLCDRVSVMKKGRIVESGNTRSLFAAPQHPYTRALFDAILEDGAASGTLEHSSDRNNPSGARS